MMIGDGCSALGILYIWICMMNGKDYEKETYEDVFMIDENNVDMYGVDGWQ